MTPFTEVLEHMAKLMPDAGGVCMNAESELEAIGMAWGAAAAGARAATGSVGQGLSLMQESLAETLLGPRAAGGAQHGSRARGTTIRPLAAAGTAITGPSCWRPSTWRRRCELVQLAFHLADRWRNPVMFMGDYYLAHVSEAVDTGTVDFGTLPRKDWALDGSTGGTGNARIVSSIMPTKRNAPAYVEYGTYLETSGEKIAAIERQMEPMYEQGGCEDADWWSWPMARRPARALRRRVASRRRMRVGFVRPVTLWPFPSAQLVAATRAARGIGVYENKPGQMIDDVRLAVPATGAELIGGLSLDSSGFGIAPESTP